MRNKRQKVLKSLQDGGFSGDGMATIKVFCTACGARLHNRKSVWQAPQLANLYYTCTNVECSETSVYELTRSHTISPSGLGDNGFIKAVLDRLRPDERQMAMDLLQNQPV